ncbi:Hypothetical protein D9617_6g095700 [Elsinoe fawcettii]|nr:Hypothetical protein D9617_6g095700 [Elsinoe fawcettii]
MPTTSIQAPIKGTPPANPLPSSSSKVEGRSGVYFDLLSILLFTHTITYWTLDHVVAQCQAYQQHYNTTGGQCVRATVRLVAVAAASVMVGTSASAAVGAFRLAVMQGQGSEWRFILGSDGGMVLVNGVVVVLKAMGTEKG